MDAFVLDHNFVTGLVDVDQQHQSLVSLLNELSACFLQEAGASDVAMEDIFTRLVAYARYHFSDEEAALPHDSSAQALLRMVAKLYRMLSEQNAELARINSHLEVRVLLRTQELERANTALKHANQQLEVFSRTDGLLKIANRQYFDERLGEECARAHRSGRPLGLLMIDVDFFKPYNDRYGHQEGDRCLQAVAQGVAAVLLRSSDLVARYGGEELGIVLPDTDAAGTLTTAQRVCDAVYALKLPHADSCVAPFVTVSVGACTLLPGGRDAATDLLALADRALYLAKDAGRNCVVVVQASN